MDTGAFYARYVKQDDHHREALKIWSKITDKKMGCITSNFVLSELITLLVYRFGSASALTAAKEIYTSHAIQKVSIEQEQEIKALTWMEKYEDQDFSMTDCTSFVVMQEMELTHAFTFDKHFRIAGFHQS